MTIGSVYRTQKHTDHFVSALEEVLDGTVDENKEMYILGDFNCDMLARHKSKITKDVIGATSDVHLEQLINEPTRITPTSSTALDLIFTSHPERIIQQDVLQTTPCHL